MVVRALIVGDERFVSADPAQRSLLYDGGWNIERRSWLELASEEPRASQHDLAIAFITHPGRIESNFLTGLRTRNPRPPTIAVLAPLLTDSFISLVADTTDDFVVCPMRSIELRQRIQRMLTWHNPSAAALRDKLNCDLGLDNLVGRHPRFLQEIAKIPAAARSGCEVLICGETGTGKELCARALHHLSPRRSQPFICVDCGALPDQLFENEVFGHARGAYTDAHREQRGLIAMAEGGTLFLDEIDSLSATAQAKLLRFLQDCSYKPLGSERYVRADVRVIAATNRNLEEAVQAKSFRRDLLFRINVLRLHMPALRERRSDIAVLAQHFLEHFCREQDARRILIPASLQLLSTLEWQGNVRELANVIRRAVVFSEGPHILPSHLVGAEYAAPAAPEGNFRRARALAIAEFERQFVSELLAKHAGNITRAAREAGQERRAFGRIVRRLGIAARSSARPPPASG
jgi:two-component system, NtrC family, response regulator GlrR